MAPKKKVIGDISLGKELMQFSELENAFKQNKKKMESGVGGGLGYKET